VCNRRGPQESVTTDLSRNFSSKLKRTSLRHPRHGLEQILSRLINERIGLELHIADLAPVGMAYQFELRRNSLRRTLYVKGSWLCCLLFEKTAPL